jgi:hypothetical protein
LHKTRNPLGLLADAFHMVCPVYQNERIFATIHFLLGNNPARFDYVAKHVSETGRLFLDSYPAAQPIGLVMKPARFLHVQIRRVARLK